MTDGTNCGTVSAIELLLVTPQARIVVGITQGDARFGSGSDSVGLYCRRNHMTVITLQTARVGVFGILAVRFMGEDGIPSVNLFSSWRDGTTADLFLTALRLPGDG